MRESRTYGSVRGALSNERPYRNICIVGKYPPIEGGVSMRTYWEAHGLAKLGHEVYVITNAKESTPPHRMFMREKDWAQCEAHYGAGSVHVLWTDSYGRRQWHIPNGTPYVTKLASIGLEVVRQQAIDLIYSYYTEPYGVAAHIVAQATGLPHVVRTAGSDTGRLWSLPQFGALYDHIFNSADAILCGQVVAQKMMQAGIKPSQIAWDPEIVRFQELFTPDGPPLDIDLLLNQISTGLNIDFCDLWFGTFDRGLSYFGVYGKLGRTKGTYALLEAIKRMRAHDFPVGLLIMGHEPGVSQGGIRKYLTANGLEDSVCQLPFLPHWRVPEFIRRCIAICCLEQDFPIRFHAPVVAREVLTCGGCLVASTEIVQKVRAARKLIDDYNCIAVKDVTNVDDLEQRLISTVQRPDLVKQIRLRAREHAIEIELGNRFPQRLESILMDIVQTGQLSSENRQKGHEQSRAETWPLRSPSPARTA
jgi:glycosyltransferase involved in cell wall biosynthesis